jgi:hypothetical protein
MPAQMQQQGMHGSPIQRFAGERGGVREIGGTDGRLNLSN